MSNPERRDKSREALPKGPKEAKRYVVPARDAVHFRGESERRLERQGVPPGLQMQFFRQAKLALDPKQRVKFELSPQVTTRLDRLKSQILHKPEHTPGGYSDKGLVAFKSVEGKNKDHLEKLPGFLYRRDINSDGGQILTGLQFLDARITLGTRLELSASRLADGILSTSDQRPFYDSFTGAVYNYEIKNYGQLFEVRAGIMNNGTRIIKIGTNIIPATFSKPYFTLEFRAGFNPRFQIEPGRIASKVKTFGIIGTCKIPIPGGKVPTVSLGAEQTKAKMDGLSVRERTYNLNLNLPFGQEHALSLYGNMSQQDSGNTRQQSFTAGAILTLRFD